MSELVGGATSLGYVALKALLMFAITVVGLRLGERRTLAQLGAFDFAVAVAAGALIGRTATSEATSVATGSVALITLLVAHRLVTTGRRHGWFAGLVDQPPRVLVAHGVVLNDELARAGLTTGDLYALLRERAVVSLDQVEYLIYENRGAVSLLRLGESPGPILTAGLAAAGYASEPRR